VVARFKEELGQDARVIGTGGLADVISQEVEVFDTVNPDLTLIGLRLIFEMNQYHPAPPAPSDQRAGEGS